MLRARYYPLSDPCPVSEKHVVFCSSELNITSSKSTNIDTQNKHARVTQIYLLHPMNTYHKKLLAALHSLYLHLASIPT